VACIELRGQVASRCVQYVKKLLASRTALRTRPVVCVSLVLSGVLCDVNQAGVLLAAFMLDRVMCLVSRGTLLVSYWLRDPTATHTCIVIENLQCGAESDPTCSLCATSFQILRTPR
jgi:hypothetical protein